MNDHLTPTPDITPADRPADGPSERTLDARSFVLKILDRCAEDRGARNALRSGLGKRLDQVPRMHRIIAPLLPDWMMERPDVQRHYYAVASMIALLSTEQSAPARRSLDEQSRYGMSLGKSLADAVAIGTRKGIRESAAETRINLLTKQSVEGLHRHLPSTIRQLQGADVAIDYARLLTDLRQWRRFRGDVTRRWLQDFYRTRFAADRKAAQQADDEISQAPIAGT